MNKIPNIEKDFEYLVEREFEYLGYKCIVLLRSTGFRYGYVGISKEHNLYGKKCFNYYIINKECMMITNYIKAHQYGVTYSSSGEEFDYLSNGLWWFGFSCDHLGDIRDKESVKKKFKNGEKELCRYVTYPHRRIDISGGGMFCSEEYVSNECKHLAEQLKYFEKSDLITDIK